MFRYITVTRSSPAEEEAATTLQVSTVLADTGSRYLEVATIRSPYSFQVRRVAASTWRQHLHLK